MTFVRVFRGAGRYRGGSVSTWVFRIAHNVAIDLARRENRKPEPGVTDAELIRDRAPSPLAAVESAERAAFLRTALAQLDSEERTTVWLRVAEELSFAEVAEITGDSTSTVRYRFLRALRRLRRHLGAPVDCGLDA